MGEPTYFDGPDYPDGTDAEGFPGGDRRFGVMQPSKEDVEAFRAAVSEVDCINNPATAAMIMKQKCLNLCDAYLALREEVREQRRKRLLEAVKYSEIVTDLKADNQALRARLNILEA